MTFGRQPERVEIATLWPIVSKNKKIYIYYIILSSEAGRVIVFATSFI